MVGTGDEAGAEAAQEDNIMVIRDLHYSRGHRKIFDGLNVSIPRGRVTAIMGPSGTGKTTLLRLMTGQILPDQGHIDIDGHDVPKLRRKELYELRKRVGMLFQNGALLSDFNVFENVAFPLREHTRLPDRLVRNIVLPKLQAVGLRGAAGLMPHELSGGMARRVALARAIAMDPELLIYDEPFVGLDPISMGVVLRLIRELNDALGISSIVVSHDVREIAAVADSAYLLAGGRVLASGKPDVLAESDLPEVRQFMRGLPDGPVPFHYPARDYEKQLLEEIWR
jgi:phospholipid/cholesterol/gamma-HCH transport system ATP-binding protein